MLSRQRLVWQVWEALAPYGVYCSHLTGQSFCKGAAIPMSHTRIEDFMIQTLRHWRSSGLSQVHSYLGQVLAATAKQLLDLDDHLNPTAD